MFGESGVLESMWSVDDCSNSGADEDGCTVVKATTKGTAEGAGMASDLKFAPNGELGSVMALVIASSRMDRLVRSCRPWMWLRPHGRVRHHERVARGASRSWAHRGCGWGVGNGVAIGVVVMHLGQEQWK